MTAFLADRLLSPRAASAATAFSAAPRTTHPGPIAAFATVMAVLRTMGEWLFFLWMVIAIAFMALVAAGAGGLLV